MKTGQIIKAKNVFELYGKVRSEIRFEDFTPQTFTIFHFTRISDNEFVVDDKLQGVNHDHTQDFIAKYPDYDTFCGVDSTGKENLFSFGSKELYATVVYTAGRSWTEVYEDHEGNPRYNEYLRTQAILDHAEKKIAS
ncbi:hypothetical protein ACLVWU_02215 [Bdellovibrio sp. HCB290]|uniref:hypothetical protein n=1 Tax=Bdellovibrio sp. HCB290 TaxID=3394356 RepID=UPI0039B4F927